MGYLNNKNDCVRLGKSYAPPVPAMILPSGSSPVSALAQRGACARRQIHLGGTALLLDHGGVQVASWPDAAAMDREIAALCELASPVVRLAGGALISDLSLQDNLMLEPALQDGCVPGSSWGDMTANMGSNIGRDIQRNMLPEIDILFAQAGCAVDWPGWAATLPADATETAVMQVRTGRALVADPDVLLVDASQWNGECIHPLAFSRSFANRYPWRVLLWITTDAAQASVLRAQLEEFTA